MPDLITHPWTLFEKEGVTYGFAAFAPNKGTMDLKDYDGAARITGHARLPGRCGDYLLSWGWGGKGSSACGEG